MRIPKLLQHRWTRCPKAACKKAACPHGGAHGSGVYHCPDCGQWTANLPLYKHNLCPAKERRKRQKDRRQYVAF